MMALGALNPVEEARAALQARLGDFLSARQRLMRLMQNPMLQIQGEAKGLYAVQLQLEDTLYKDIFPKLQKFQAGQWSLSEVIEVGTFTNNVNKQISDVNRLDAQAGGSGGSTGIMEIDNTMLTVGGVALVGAILLLWYARR